ncbi:uncharacterized protein PHACADRAFT_139802 [Phanerochaete carnosa HHB-10118-sp]|uniref:Uncharacterized protein n=1 Tax=Phanerochaete carnosa (strain HHB-10118-sp) TaxID=650164 RepID=K5W2N3_PHACS|nr:uncharacterized protein PHACADRAFT_139802 [Phanerochaete carnosa HHB-10118-sp]EKM58138.1 hypothetical protein PHACADRAFT_139802 [Phanerochaete carnosa HHB-10118-sp]
MAVSVDLLVLIGFACEALLYGAYCVLFLTSLYVLFWMWRSRGFNTTILVLHCLLFVACTLHFALEYNHFYTYLSANGVNGFGDEDYHTFIADCTVSVADFLGDLILIYRCWIIWSGNYWITVLPLLSSVGGLICSAVVGHLVWGTTGATVSPAIVPLGLASFVLPLCTNVLATGLIVARVWWMGRGGRMYALSGGGATRKAMHVIIESGALYFLVQLVFVVVYGLNDPSADVMIAIAVQTYGIASTLIIIHVGLGLSSEQTTKTAAILSVSWTKRSSIAFSGGGGASSTAQHSSGDAIELRVHQTFNFHRSYNGKPASAGRAGSSLESVGRYPLDQLV